MPDIKVLRVETNHSEKYGDKKVLHLEDGSKWNVNEKKSFYSEATGPGIYTADFKEFQGKPYISYLRFKSALDGQNQATASVSNASGTTTAKSNYDGNLAVRLAADKKRQDDIRLEFYCGVAKDILIANKKKDEDINWEDVIAIGLELYKKHIATLDMMIMQDVAKAKPVESKTGTQYERAKAALEEAKAAEAEEPPF